MHRNHRLIVKSAAPLVAAVLLTASTGALAHPGHGAHTDGFAGGLAHPFTGIDHLLVMIGVGVWSAILARRAWPDLLWAPLGFVALLLVGAALGVAGVRVPFVEPAIAVSLVAVGLLIATRARMPAIAAAGVVGTFALFHGLAHGGEFAQSHAGAGAAIAGMALGTVALHLLGVAFGWSLLRADGRNAPLTRLAGSGVASFGAFALYGLLAG